MSIPGPTLVAEVGDVLVVHFRNADTKLNQAVTVHPHGVKYNPEYDGAYMGTFTRAGGFIAPGETFTYQWECTPGVGRRVAVPRPRPQPHAEHVPRTVRRDHRPRPRAPSGRTASYTSSHTSCRRRSPACTQNFQCFNGRAYAGNTPTLRSKVGEDVEINAFGMDANFHTFHIHGHRWQDPAGAFVDNPAMGPNERVTARFIEDNPGRWLYHCHVFTHQDAGMAGWYVVDP